MRIWLPTAPLKGIPSQAPPPRAVTIPTSNVSRTLSRTPAGKKEGGVKLLDITEQPVGFQMQKRRKKQQGMILTSICSRLYYSIKPLSLRHSFPRNWRCQKAFRGNRKSGWNAWLRCRSKLNGSTSNTSSTYTLEPSPDAICISATNATTCRTTCSTCTGGTTDLCSNIYTRWTSTNS